MHTGEIEITEDLDRIGSPYGNNLGVVENGHHCTQNERSICFIENENARNCYKFDKTFYKDAIDAIKDFDINNPYGVMGRAEKWIVNGEKITDGGVGQINTPINVKVLEQIGITKNTGGW